MPMCTSKGSCTDNCGNFGGISPTVMSYVCSSPKSDQLIKEKWKTDFIQKFSKGDVGFNPENDIRKKYISCRFVDLESFIENLLEQERESWEKEYPRYREAWKNAKKSIINKK